MNFGPNCTVTDSLVVMTTDHKEVTHAPVSTVNSTFCQRHDNNKRQRLISE
jgi:hypothetical protein